MVVLVVVVVVVNNNKVQSNLALGGIVANWGSDPKSPLPVEGSGPCLIRITLMAPLS